MVTAVLFHPATFGAGASGALTCSGGNGLSVNCALAVAGFPALSRAVPLMFCGPPLLTVIGVGQPAIPERLSAQVKLTEAALAETMLLTSGAGKTDAVMTGAVLSRLMVTLVVAVCPTESVTEPLMTRPAPAMVTDSDPGHASGGTPPE